MLTRQEFAVRLHQVNEKVLAWEASDAPIVQWQGGPRKAISDALIKAFHEIFEMAGTNEVEQSAKPIILAVDQFEDALATWAEDCDISPEDTDPRGTQSLWIAWGEIFEVLKTRQARKPEDIRTLVAEKVSDRQIAMIYGWKDESGEFDLQKVREEKANPGTHYNPETWVHPSEVRMAEEVEAKWKDRQHRIDEKVAAKYVRKECPETIDELIVQRVPSKQIAMMKDVDIEVVRKRAAELGIPLDGQFVRRVSQIDQLADVRNVEIQRDAEVQSEMQSDQMEQSGTLVDKILELYVAEKTPGEIAEILKVDHPKLTHQKVAAIIRKAEEEAEAARV